MYRWIPDLRNPLPALMAGLLSVATTCGGATSSESKDSAAIIAHVEDACLPAAPMGVAVGDSWTIHGIVRLDVEGAGDEPSTAELFTTFKITGIDDGRLETEGGGTQQVDHAQLSVQVELGRALVTGQWLSTRQHSRGENRSLHRRHSGLGVPRRTWLGSADDGPEGAGFAGRFSVEDSVLTSDLDVVVFAAERDDSNPEGDRIASRFTEVGYGRLTGRMVLKTSLAYGLKSDETCGRSSFQTIVDGPVRVPMPPPVITPFLPHRLPGHPS